MSCLVVSPVAGWVVVAIKFSFRVRVHEYALVHPAGLSPRAATRSNVCFKCRKTCSTSQERDARGFFSLPDRVRSKGCALLCCGREIVWFRPLGLGLPSRQPKP